MIGLQQFAEELITYLRSDRSYSHLSGGDWGAGGCSLLAHALCRVIPGASLVAIGRPGIPDHLLIAVQEDDGKVVFIDFDGIHSMDTVLDDVANALNIGSSAGISLQPPPSDEYLQKHGMHASDSPEIDALVSDLSTLRGLSLRSHPDS